MHAKKQPQSQIAYKCCVCVCVSSQRIFLGTTKEGTNAKHNQKQLKIAENVYIAENVVLKNSQGLTIGSNFSLHEFSYIDAIGGIEIGDNVSIAHNCSLVSFEHTWNDRETPIKYNSTINHPIFIGDDVWIGCGVRVLSGAVIENRVVVAAGAVVKGTLEAGYLYGGIPARKLKKL